MEHFDRRNSWLFRDVHQVQGRGDVCPICGKPYTRSYRIGHSRIYRFLHRVWPPEKGKDNTIYHEYIRPKVKRW